MEQQKGRAPRSDVKGRQKGDERGFEYGQTIKNELSNCNGQFFSIVPKKCRPNQQKPVFHGPAQSIDPGKDFVKNVVRDSSQSMGKGSRSNQSAGKHGQYYPNLQDRKNFSRSTDKSKCGDMYDCYFQIKKMRAQAKADQKDVQPPMIINTKA